MRRIIPIAAVAPSALEGAALAFSSLPPLSLYVHVPWCVRKCPYCDFNSHEAKGDGGSFPEAEYVAALIADLESALPLIWGRREVSIFFGGGTPSLLSGAAVAELLSAFRARLSLLPEAEITLEANPGTVEAERFAAYRAAGVNRLSLGIQSFDDAQLGKLGRIHNAADARRAIAIAQAHFDNFNLDLMTALPGQSLAAALAEVDAALAYEPPHLSCYQLTIEANTHFAQSPPADLPDDELQADILDAVSARIVAAGYQHYETSAYAKSGRQCQHNRNYWEFGDYLGIGAGAHGKLTSHNQVLRQMRWKQPKEYLARVAAGQPVHTETSVAGSDLRFEFMLNALRLNQGFHPALFEQRTAQPLASVVKELRRAADEGLLAVSAEGIVPSERGRRLLNTLLERFL